jgi:hypothetical protein
MHNSTKFIAISLANLDTVTGGYHDADPPAPPVDRGGWFRRLQRELRTDQPQIVTVDPGPAL